MSRVLPTAVGFLVAAVSAVALSAGAVRAADDPPNTLTAKEKAEGWRLLFDGKSLSGWRAFKSETTPAAWKAVDGTLARVADGGGDIMTSQQYATFELKYDWKLPEKGNSGVMFHVTSEGNETYETGPEMQVLHNQGHKDGAIPKRSAGSNYDLHAPVKDVTRPIGEWNEARLVVKGPHVEHWLNGVKLLEYELWSPEWEKLVKESKFATMPHYGRAKTGHIVFQDHGNPVWFRNVKIKTL